MSSLAANLALSRGEQERLQCELEQQQQSAAASAAAAAVAAAAAAAAVASPAPGSWQCSRCLGRSDGDEASTAAATEEISRLKAEAAEEISCLKVELGRVQEENGKLLQQIDFDHEEMGRQVGLGAGAALWRGRGVTECNRDRGAQGSVGDPNISDL